MANVIDQLMIGIGFDVDEQSAQKVDSAMDSMTDKAMKLGAVLTAGFGAKALTLDFADANDELGKFARVNDLSAQKVKSLEEAIIGEGGSVQSLRSDLLSLNDARRAYQMQGDVSRLGAAAMIGFDVSDVLEASNATDAYIALANKFASATPDQRNQLAQIFGLDESSVRFLSKGVDAVEAELARQEKIRPVLAGATEESERFNGQMQDLFNNIGHVADKISIKLLPAISDAMESVNAWFDENKDLLDLEIDKYLGIVADNFELIAAGAALFVGAGAVKTLTSLAGLLPGLSSSMSTFGRVASTTFGVFAAYEASKFGADWADKKLREVIDGYDKADEEFTKWVYNTTGLDLSRGNVFEGKDRELPSKAKPMQGNVPGNENYFVGQPVQSSNPYVMRAQQAQAEQTNITIPSVVIQVSGAGDPVEVANEVQRAINDQVKVAKSVKGNNVK
ncbi:tail fiber protein/lysozyme [Vibrio phage vB_VpM-pA2SJ1]|uniref:Tail fiber protein/lysozyme n=1 Tax=Vibrio phage vB_VpM-pA2SJ1 TaxID=3095964 RepID=A0AAX4J6E1_9CAUD